MALLLEFSDLFLRAMMVGEKIAVYVVNLASAVGGYAFVVYL